MARTTEEIRSKRLELVAEGQRMEAEMKKAREDGPTTQIRALMKECEGLGHPNITPDNSGEFPREICPDCGYYKYM